MLGHSKFNCVLANGCEGEKASVDNDKHGLMLHLAAAGADRKDK